MFVLLSTLHLSLFTAPAIAQQAPPPIALARTAKAGDKLAYDVKSHIQTEARGGALQTWLPQSYDYDYAFTSHVIEMKPGGLMLVHYQRPTLTETVGETEDSGPQRHTIKENFNLEITVSPLNELINMKDLNSVPGGSGGRLTNNSLMLFNAAPTFGSNHQSGQLARYLQQFVGEIYSLALNAGSFDSALDFAPKLPLDNVKPGDTWKHTVGYTPQRLQGTAKDAVQRMDYVYTYRGIADAEGRKVYRITADLDLKTDIAGFFHQSLGAKREDTGIKAIPMNLKTHIDFDLDLDSRATLKAVSESQGGFSVLTSDNPDLPAHEERFTGHTVMRLTGRAG